MAATELKRIVVLTSGGDAPGMNAGIRAVVRTALYHRVEVFAAENGYQGLLNKQLIPMTSRSVANIIQKGGTVLKTGRVPGFREKANRDQVRAFLAENHIDGLVVLGGDGSFRGASLLHQEGGPPVIGIPCTIDNDIAGSEYCIGFDTACQTALEAIDKIRDTAFSLDRHFMIEVMGRSSGFIAVNVGVAGGAEIILTPEFPISIDELSAKIKSQVGKKLASIIVVAEADAPGHSMQLAAQIEQHTGLKYRVCILGHVQRGGAPSCKDRMIASLMGAKAVEALLRGETERMMALHHGDIITVPFPAIATATRYFSDQSLLQTNEVICEIW